MRISELNERLGIHNAEDAIQKPNLIGEGYQGQDDEEDLRDPDEE